MTSPLSLPHYTSTPSTLSITPSRISLLDYVVILPPLFLQCSVICGSIPIWRMTQHSWNVSYSCWWVTTSRSDSSWSFWRVVSCRYWLWSGWLFVFVEWPLSRTLSIWPSTESFRVLSEFCHICSYPISSPLFPSKSLWLIPSATSTGCSGILPSRIFCSLYSSYSSLSRSEWLLLKSSVTLYSKSFSYCLWLLFWVESIDIDD